MDEMTFESLKKEMGIETPPPTVTEPVVTEPAAPVTEPATPANATPEVDPVPATEPVVEPTVTEPVVAPTPAATEPAKGNKSEDSAQARAFAEMRVENAKYKKLVKQMADAEGITPEEYLKKLEDQAVATRATALQTSPEVLRRLDAAEAALREQEDLRVQNHIQSEFGNLQRTFNLTEAELSAFAEQLAQKGHDFRNVSTDYAVLYRGLNHDILIEKERQAWISRNQKAVEHAPKTVTTTGSGAGVQTPKINSVADMEAFLNSQMPSKK